MLKILDRGPTRKNRFLILDGETTIGVFEIEKDAKNRLNELRFGQDAETKSKKAKFKSSKGEK